MKNDNALLFNIDKVHSTEMGINRIKNNLELDVNDIVKWCQEKIFDKNSLIIKKGKNWYVTIANCIITINAHSYTIITAHKLKKL